MGCHRGLNLDPRPASSFSLYLVRTVSFKPSKELKLDAGLGSIGGAGPGKGPFPTPAAVATFFGPSLAPI